MNRLSLAAGNDPRLRIARSVAAGVALLLVVGAIAWRTAHTLDIPGSGGPTDGAQNDFNDAIWFPVQFFLSGGNPYGEAYREFHPEGLGVSFYSPFAYLFFACYGPIPLEVAQWVNFALIVLGLPVLSWVSLSLVAEKKRPGAAEVLGFTVFLAASRAGYSNLYSGQITILVVLGAYLALLAARDRPRLAGLGLLLVSLKPNFLVPLGVLLLLRRDFRALAWGALFSIGGAGLAISWIALRGEGFLPFFRGIAETYLLAESHPEVAGVEEIGWLVINPGAFLAHWAGDSTAVTLAVATAILAAAGWVVFRSGDSSRSFASPVLATILLGVLLSVFHAAYDMLLLAAPVAAILLGRGAWSRADPRLRFGGLCCLVPPLYNYASTNLGRGLLDPPEPLWVAISVSNALLLTIGFAIVILAASAKPESEALDKA